MCFASAIIPQIFHRHAECTRDLDSKQHIWNALTAFDFADCACSRAG
nr:MAG TPA: hypothetical protein [Caudoviricetes sp.]